MKKKEIAARHRMEELGYPAEFVWGLKSETFRNLPEKEVPMDRLDKNVVECAGLSPEQIRFVGDTFAQANVPGQLAIALPSWLWWWLIKQLAKQAAFAAAKGAAKNAIGNDNGDEAAPALPARPVGTDFSSGWFENCQSELIGELRPGESIRVKVSWNGGGWSPGDDPGVVTISKDGTPLPVIRGDGEVTITGPGVITAHLTGNEDWCWIESVIV